MSSEPYHERMREFLEELKTKDEWKILQQLATKAEIGHPEDAVARTIGLTKSSASGTNTQPLGNHLYDTACCVLEWAALSEETPRLELLAQYVAHLSERTLKQDGRPLEYEGESVWADLPTFGYTFADELGSFDPTAENNDLDVRRWFNLTAFVAILTKTSRRTDFSRWALTAVRTAFGPYEDWGPEPTNDVAAQTAAVWFLQSGEQLYEYVTDNRRFEPDQEGPPDFDINWWNDSKKGLKDAYGKFNNELLYMAVNHMEKIEQQ